MKRAALLALAVSLVAQESRFDAQSRLVLVPVTVTDREGRAVPGLEASDFLVFDNGRPRTPTVDTLDTGVPPIALVIAVQASGISAAVLEKVQKIEAMIQPLITGERGCVGLVSFADEVKRLQDCTKDPRAIEHAFLALRIGEHTAARMLDAVQASVEHLGRQQSARRVLLLISESRDRGSTVTLDAAARAAQGVGVTIYSATYSAFKTGFTSKAPVTPDRPAAAMEPPKDGSHPTQPNPKLPPEERVDILGALRELGRLGDPNAAEVLTTSTGGTVLPFTRQKALEKAIHTLGNELHSQYVLSFVPEEDPAGYHAIEVRLRRPGAYRIRARPGYWVTDRPR